MRRPHGKRGALDPVNDARLRAELLPQAKMPPFTVQVEIDIAQRRQEAIWIFK